MKKHIGKIFMWIVVAGIFIYLIGEIPNILNSAGDLARENNFVKSGVSANVSNYFGNFSNVGKKYYNK